MKRRNFFALVLGSVGALFGMGKKEEISYAGEWDWREIKRRLGPTSLDLKKSEFWIWDGLSSPPIRRLADPWVYMEVNGEWKFVKESTLA